MLKRKVTGTCALLSQVTSIVFLASSSLALAETPEDQASLRNYKELCGQVQRRTWEMRTTLCAMLETDEEIVRTMIAAQVQDVCGNIDRDCSSANEQARGRLKFFASKLKCPVGSSVCTREMARQVVVINEKILGTISPIRQKPYACWATVATMLYNWKNNRSDSVASAMAKVGSTYLDIFNRQTGLEAKDKPGFLFSMGLKTESPQNYTAQGWASLIRRYGPIWVTTNEGTTQKFSIHARIMTAIFGDGSPRGTTVVVVDPDDGRVHTESLEVFAKKFEEVAMGAGSGDLRPQVVHY